MRTIDINEIEKTPIFSDKKCIILMYFLSILLRFLNVAITLLVLYLYGYFIAFTTLLLTFLLMGIVRSKLLHSSIPIHQREYKYSDKEIVSWYISKYIC